MNRLQIDTMTISGFTVHALDCKHHFGRADQELNIFGDAKKGQGALVNSNAILLQINRDAYSLIRYFAHRCNLLIIARLAWVQVGSAEQSGSP